MLDSYIDDDSRSSASTIRESISEARCKKLFAIQILKSYFRIRN